MVKVVSWPLLVAICHVAGSPSSWPTSADIGAYDFEIVTPTYCGIDSLFSVNYIGATYATGMKELREANPRLNVTHRNIMNSNATTDCLIQRSNVQDVLARWYYQEKRTNSIPVWITPGCMELDYVNQLAHAWNILLITTVNIDATIRNKALAPTWIATTRYSSNCGEFYKGFLQRNNWTTVATVLDLDLNGPPIFTNLAVTTARHLKEYGYKLTSFIRTAQDPAAITLQIDAILLAVRGTCRVVLYYGTASALRHFLIRATKNDMINENYVYIASRPMPHSLFGSFTWQEGRDDDEIVRAAYRSVILVQVIYADEAQQVQRDKLAFIWKGLSKTSTLRIPRELPLIYLENNHGAFQMLGKMLANLTQSGDFDFSTLKSGRHFAAQFYFKTFHLDHTTISLNGAGVRATTQAIKQLNNDTGEIEIFLIAREKKDYSYEWQTIKSPSWYGNSNFPPNEPFCGFAGLAAVCLEKESHWKGMLTVIIIVIFLVSCALFIATILARVYIARHTLNWWLLNEPILQSVRRRLSSIISKKGSNSSLH
ncbi:hypothetical protein BV898_11875 [Hypsibius exemplaris]|uniref:Receptor ligand binding region domain-containing protein n=1 Tax=Hypsibius exemplaris TaxID=2072580 RepID=A0A1W0WFC2_HYPEX|nr:hypothetical protein BV898_11875 [Hypsibius exemplaris]